MQNELQMMWLGTWSSLKPAKDGKNIHARVFTEYAVGADGKNVHVVLLDAPFPSEDVAVAHECIQDATATAEARVKEMVERAYHESLNGGDPRTAPPSAGEVLRKHDLAA